jgi:hypothetical protein
MPNGPLEFGAFAGQFRADGTFSITGQGWAPLSGNWKANGPELELQFTKAPSPDCASPGRYTFAVTGSRVSLQLVEDRCTPRRMILDRSTWRPAGEKVVVPARTIVRTGAASAPPLPAAGSARGSWPSFRGTQASGVADGQNLPDQWNVKTGEHILWRPAIPDRLGRSRLRHERHQPAPERNVQTGTLRRRRRVGRSLAAPLDDLCRRQEDRPHPLGARGARERAAQQAARQIHVRQRDAGD